MTADPLVSVIIPCYNAEKWIREAVCSVLHQTYENIEIIIIDDGSTDDSLHSIPIRHAPKTKRRVRIMRLCQNYGACAACDTGFSLSDGKYSCMLAADDCYIDPEHIAKQVSVMESSEIDFCYNSRNLIGPSKETAEEAQGSLFSLPIRYSSVALSFLDNLILEYPGLCHQLISRGNPINSGAMMIRMSSYRENDLSWTRWGDRSVCDTSLLLAMFERGLIGKAIRSAGVFYRIHPGQISKDPAFIREREKRLGGLRT